jgi:GNAT superfamily N-acetyltransferase
MATEALSPPRRQLPELEYRQVLNDATARDLATTNAQAYGMPMETWEGICNMQLWRADTYGFVAYHGGDAVSAAAVFPIDGAMYVQWVATSPTEQRKGYAEAVMRKAIELAQAESGLRRIILHATDMGQPLYQSMGFIAGCQIPLFSAG